MAKRGLCILLALAAVFSLSAPALAEEEPVTTEEPVVTEEPVEAAEVVETEEEPVEEPEEVVEEPEGSVEAETVAVTETGSCGGAATYTLTGDGVLTINGGGVIWDSAFSGWDGVNTVIIKGTVTRVGNHTFSGCTSLTSVTFPSSLTSIGDGAFFDCTSLPGITLPNGLTSIGESAFVDCTSLTSVTFPGGATNIGGFAFSGCTSLSGVTMSGSTITIGEYAFYSCTLLKSVTIQSNALTIGESAFASCTSLTSLKLQSSAAIIGEGAFFDCASLKSATLPDGMTSVADTMFLSCTSLSDVTIPSRVTSIGASAFGGCTSLSSVTIPDSVTSIGGAAFAGTSLGSVTIPKSVSKIDTNAFDGCLSLASLTVLNPKCVIAEPMSVSGETFYALGDPGTTVIHGYEGSTAQTHANQYGYKFEALGAVPTDTPVPQLAAPTVKIEKVSTGIKVSWNKISGSPRYMVYYKEGNGSWKKIGTTTSTTYTRKAAQLKNGTTYTFTVRCCENDKKTLLGPYKASNSLKYTAQLAAPTVKIAKVAGGIKVSWNKIAGSPRYMVYYKENGGGWKKIGTTTSTTYTRAAKYLKNGVTYQFTVRCCANDKKTLLGPYKASNSLKYTK